MNIIEELKEDEGFSSTEYICPTGHPSIGYGTKLPLLQEEIALIDFNGEYVDEEQASKLLEYRLNIAIHSISSIQPIYNDLDNHRQEVIQNMIYQLGVNGTTKFYNMWKALDKKKYCDAALHMLDSKWFKKQTSSRAFKLAMKMKSL